MSGQLVAKVAQHKVKTVAAGAAVAAVAAVAGFGLLGGDAVPAGAHTVQVYTVDDSISYEATGELRPGLYGRTVGLCDGDTHYIEYAGGEHCLVLSGPLGDVTAEGGDQGVVLPPAEHSAILDLVRAEDAAGPVTRVVLEYDGSFVGVVAVSSLDSTDPASVTPID
ncbi:hypothetical protein JQS43_23410 [Natronosporangium hydrolyticum]|uniref:Uncharacterized protein n=1 Tax=Natronosporangium hydrolyticum TaxID=2811111 RepID=A0A895YE06_9ACTN|nr:hypothetical protein [Natronosporangium hydrolyticum]QSB14405.1 hypothetical protein JQS43_23410 [Natronosporangium hydrolyticum]